MRSLPAIGSPWAGRSSSRFQGGHLAQRRRPLERVALHLLGVARVGEDPGDEVSGADGAVLRHPGPQVVVGFAPSVAELEAQVSDAYAHPLAKGRVRLHPRGRPEARSGVGSGFAEQSVAAELPGVDDRVVAVRRAVAGEAIAHVLVSHDPGARSRRARGRRRGRPGRRPRDRCGRACRPRCGRARPTSCAAIPGCRRRRPRGSCRRSRDRHRSGMRRRARTPRSPRFRPRPRRSPALRD